MPLRLSNRAKNNTAQIPCDCDDFTPEDESSVTESEEAYMEILQESHCVSSKNWVTGDEALERARRMSLVLVILLLLPLYVL